MSPPPYPPGWSAARPHPPKRVLALLLAAAFCVAAWHATRARVAHANPAAVSLSGGGGGTRRPGRDADDFSAQCQARVYAGAADVAAAAEPHACWCSCTAVAGADMSDFRGRARAKCPDGSLERHRLLCHLLMTRLDGHAASRILFISPDPSAFEFVVKAFPRADIVGGYKHVPGSYVPEASRPMVDVDLTSMAFPDASFDLVIVQHVFEHIEQDGVALREVHRVLTPGGKGFFEVPITAPAGTIENVDGVSTQDDRLRVYGQGDHVRRYGKDFYDRVQAAGFDVDIVQYTAHFERHVASPVDLYNKELRSKSTMCIATKPGA